MSLPVNLTAPHRGAPSYRAHFLLPGTGSMRAPIDVDIDMPDVSIDRPTTADYVPIAVGAVVGYMAGGLLPVRILGALGGAALGAWLSQTGRI